MNRMGDLNGRIKKRGNYKTKEGIGDGELKLRAILWVETKPHGVEATYNK